MLQTAGQDESRPLILVLDAEQTIREDKEQRTEMEETMGIGVVDRREGGDIGENETDETGGSAGRRDIGVNTESCDLWNSSVQKLPGQRPSSTIDEYSENETGTPHGTSAGFTVVGRLSVTGTKKKTYVVTEEEINRRIQVENMSTNVFRSLFGVGKLIMMSSVRKVSI